MSEHFVVEAGIMSALIPHPTALLEGRLRARYDRFIAEVDLEGRLVDAHCVNPGKMEGLVRPGVRAWLSRALPGSKRKLAYTLELLEHDGRVVGANTNAPNRIAEALIRAKALKGLSRYRSVEREVRYGEKSRVDLRLAVGSRHHYIEVKNCHLVYPDGCAYFPDSVSARASGHLSELARQCEAGDLATVLFVVQRTDANRLRPSALHDPAFSEAARDARRRGVRFRAVLVDPRVDGYRYVGEIPVVLGAYDPARIAPYRVANDPWSGWTRRGGKLVAARV
ncbi:MAG: DNA/RNA nuclease SfsA [Myxococcota bacterium]